MRSILFISFFLFIGVSSFAQKKVAVSVMPADASIFEVLAESNELKLLGVGAAVVAVPKKSQTTVIIRKTGYADLVVVYDATAEEKLPKKEILELHDREVEFKVIPADAKVFANGAALQSGVESIVIKKGQKIDLEVKMPGFVGIKKTYTNIEGSEMPPINEELRLTDRILQMVASPSDATIYVDDKVLAEGNGEVIIPLNQCVLVSIKKDGFMSVEQTYCNKEGAKPIPNNATFNLVDRFVTIKSDHADAIIKINGREVGKGFYGIKVAKGECVDVSLDKEGYIQSTKTFCNQDNAPSFGAVDSVTMVMDESFTTSSTADYVNVNNIIAINPALKEDAWKIMSQAVLSVFDVIEITDKETGYLLTAWAYKMFPNNTVRTRLIVKIADSTNSKFAIKLSSEFSGAGGSNINDDSLFKEWNRVLDKYKDLISTIEQGLK